MMEATTHNLLGRLIILLVFIIWFHFPGFIRAQSSQPDSKLSQLLDSADILKLKKQYDRSIEICESVSSKAAIKADWESQARALNELSELYRRKNNVEQAEIYLLKAQEIIARHLSDSSIEKARNIFYEGNVLLSKSEYSIDSVFSYYEKALISHEKLNQKNIDFLADIFFKMGKTLYENGDLDRSMKYYSQLEKLLVFDFESIDYKRGHYLFNVAQQYYNIGDYERSFILAEIACYIFNEKNLNDFSKYLDCEKLLANNHSETQNFSEAIIQYKRIIALIKSQIGVADKSLLGPLANICQSLINTGAYMEAIDYAGQAMDLIDKHPEFKRFQYYVFNFLAEAYEKKGDYSNAEKYFKLTIRHRIQLFGPNNEQVYEGYRYFAEYFSRRAEHMKALEYYNKSFMALYEEFKPEDIFDNPDFGGYENTEQLLYAIFGKAGSLFSLYQQTSEIEALETSLNLYVQVYGMVNKLLDGNYLDKSSIQLFKRFEEDFDMSVDCAIALYEISSDEQYLEQAFQFIEKNKYILLFKALVNTGENATINTTANMEEGNLSMHIDELRQEIISTQNIDSLFSLRNSLVKNLVLKDELNPGLVERDNLSIDSDKKVVTLKDAQNLILNHDELIIEYHWSENFIYAFLLRKNNIDIVKIKWSLELEKTINTYSGSISAYSDTNADLQKFINAAFSLYSTLFQPIEENIGNADTINRLIIVPDGPLSSLPFEAFLSDSVMPSTTNYWSLQYLCRKYTFSYAYSLNILERNLEQKASATNPKMLALSYSNILERNSDIEQLRSENELPYSGEEIKRIKKQIRAKSYLGEHATEDIFKAKASDYSLIHLALHGQADTLDMFNSKLIFKPDPKGIEDGELHAYELYSLDLKNLEMVVLSACETGIGKQYEGEGIFSIARGFAYAGCPSIVMSLWKVNDKATAKLMDFYYANLSQGFDKDKALQLAKIDFIHEGKDLGSHPSNWAAFINLGNNRPIQIPSSMYYWYYVFAACCLLFITIWWSRRKKSIKV